MSVLFYELGEFIATCYKELILANYYPAFTTSIGIATRLWHYLLMGAVSATTVASFEQVGAILVVALLIAPAATAYLLTDNFKQMLVISSGVGVISSLTGYYLAVWVDSSIAGAIAVMAGIFFTLALLFSPKHGALRKRMSPNPTADTGETRIVPN